jgi:predicted Holliday junction resolvase-like endonuclease
VGQAVYLTAFITLVVAVAVVTIVLVAVVRAVRAAVVLGRQEMLQAYQAQQTEAAVQAVAE